MELKHGMMEQYLLGSTKMGERMVKVSKLGKINQSILEILKTIRFVEQEYILGLMVDLTKDNGMIIK